MGLMTVMGFARFPLFALISTVVNSDTFGFGAGRFFGDGRFSGQIWRLVVMGI